MRVSYRWVGLPEPDCLGMLRSTLNLCVMCNPATVLGVCRLVRSSSGSWSRKRIFLLRPDLPVQCCRSQVARHLIFASCAAPEYYRGNWPRKRIFLLRPDYPSDFRFLWSIVLTMKRNYIKNLQISGAIGTRFVLTFLMDENRA